MGLTALESGSNTELYPRYRHDLNEDKPHSAHVLILPRYHIILKKNGQIHRCSKKCLVKFFLTTHPPIGQLFCNILFLCFTNKFFSCLLMLCRSGIGSYHGTIGGPVKSMSPLEIPKKIYKSPGKNFYTSPPKKGSGYGSVKTSHWHDFTLLDLCELTLS